jgi:hypothetical protein
LSVKAEAHRSVDGFGMNFPVDAQRRYRRLTLLFVGLLALGTTAGIIVPAGPGWDFANFYDAGSKVAAGQIQDLYNPHSLIRGKNAQGSLQFFGAPISALIYAPLGYFSPGVALVLFKIENTLAYFLALFLLYRHCRRFVEDTPIAQSAFAATFAFISLIYQPFWTVYRVGGQSMPTVFLLLTVALLAHTAGGMFWSALCLVLAVLIKPAFLSALALVAIVSGPRFICYSAVVAAFSGLLSVALMGWQVHLDFLTALKAASNTFYPWFYNSSIYVLIDNLRIYWRVQSEVSSYSVFSLAATAARVFLVALFVYLIARGRLQSWSAPAKRHFHFCMAVAFCLFLAPVVWEHYLSVLFFPLAYIIASRRHFSGGAMAVIGSIFFLAVWQNLILVNFLRYNFVWDTLFELISVGLLKSAPLLLFLYFLLRYKTALLESYSAPAWRPEVPAPARG